MQEINQSQAQPNYTNGIYINTQLTTDLLATNQILLKLTFRELGNSVKGDKTEIQTDADKSRLVLTKKLIDCPEYEAISSFVSATQKWLLTRALPANRTFKAGFYRVPIELLEELDQELTLRSRTFNSLVSAFCDVYWTAVEKAKDALGPQFRWTDYKSEDNVRASFGMSWTYLSFSTPDSLPGPIAERERESMRESLAQALEECREALRTAFRCLVDRAADRLRSDPSGKPLRYTRTLEENFNDFLSYFQARNSLAQDSQLSALVAKARAILSECPPLTELKGEGMEGVRARVQSQFSALQSEIEGAQLLPGRTRSIQLD